MALVRLALSVPLRRVLWSLRKSTARVWRLLAESHSHFTGSGVESLWEA
jgi:hypothetical protein